MAGYSAGIMDKPKTKTKTKVKPEIKPEIKPEKEAKKALTPEEELALMRKKFGYEVSQHQSRFWLDTGSKQLNAVLGSPGRGLAYGKFIDLHGPESNGKTLIGLMIASAAQRDGAVVGWADFEESWDDSWATSQSVDKNKLYMFAPKMVENRKGKIYLQSAEDVWEEIITWMQRQHSRNPDGKICLVVDSVSAMCPRIVNEANMEDSDNMRIQLALSRFLAQLFRRLVAISRAYNALIVFINQERESPGIMFGNPIYTPGGKAQKFYYAVRARVHRSKGGKLIQGGNVIGIKAVIRNIKNKAGEGSREGETVGFKAYFHKPKWVFMSSDKLKQEDAED